MNARHNKKETGVKGWELFLHSVKQVFGNMGAAVRISGLLFLVQAVATVFLGRSAMTGGPDGMANGPAAPSGALLLMLIVTLVTSLWIAVAWHRYILRVEEPGSIIPPFYGQRLLAYLGYSLLIGIIVVIPAALLGAFAGLILSAFHALGGGAMMVGTLLWLILVLVPIILLSLRLSPALPAAALGEPMGIKGAWAATEGAWPDLLVLAVIAGVASILIDLPALIGMGSGAFVVLWSLLAAWVKMMVGASVLTTVYGHYVEKRQLSA
jgi:hypothetical protein